MMIGTLKSRTKNYPHPVSNLLRYRISIIKYSIVYFFSLLVFYIALNPFKQESIIPALPELLISGLVVSFYFIFLSFFIYHRIITKVKHNLETERIRELERLLHNQIGESKAFHRELMERTVLLEQQSEEIKKKNLELKLAQHEIREKANYLEIVSRYKSEFFANISHDLRTPLNSIIVLSQLIAENRPQNLTEKQKEFAKTIYSSGNVLLDFINEILELTRIESGKIELRPENVSLWELVDQLKMMFQPVAQQKGLEFSIILEDELPEMITTDSKRLHQVLRNLLSNAIKFTDKGNVSMQISRPKSDLPPHKLNHSTSLAISIVDTGIGVADDQQSEIFEAFQQADGTTSSKYGGTGLGLTIARSLSALLGGELLIRSKLGEGSVFTLVIPENLPEGINKKYVLFLPWRGKNLRYAEASLTSQDDCYSQDDRDNIRKGDRVILIVDDDASFANLLLDFAREANYKGLIAANAECALKMAKDYQPGLIIMDICLPGTNGWEVHDLLKKDPYTSQIPVFYISGADEKNEVTEMGAIGFLTKPVSASILKLTFDSFANLTTVPVFSTRTNGGSNSEKNAVPIDGDKSKIKTKQLN